MKTCTVSESKSKLGELADSAIHGKPTVIVRGGKLVVLQAHELPDHPDEFDTLIQAGTSANLAVLPGAFENVTPHKRPLQPTGKVTGSVRHR